MSHLNLLQYIPPLRSQGSLTPPFLRGQRGLTVIELLVAIAIFGVLVGVARVGLGSLAPQFNIDNGARTLTMALNQARVQAITRGHTVDAAVGGGGFSIFDVNNGNELLAEGELPAHITVSSGNAVFTPLGTLNTNLSTSVPLTFAVSNGSHTRNITVGLIGEVQVQ